MRPARPADRRAKGVGTIPQKRSNNIRSTNCIQKEEVTGDCVVIACMEDNDPLFLLKRYIMNESHAHHLFSIRHPSPNSSHTPRNSSSAASRFSTIPLANTSGSGRFSASSRLLSFNQNISKLTLSLAIIQS